MPVPSDQEGRARFQRACAYLFTPDHARDPDFLERLNAGMVKQAFRTKARQYHPDLNPHEPLNLKRKRRERFVRIKESYDYLRIKLPEPEPSGRSRPETAPLPHRPFVIAVGGAKGGIGKSLFAANLAVTLSSMGYRTVAADLDLGGANLHLYLGKTRLKRTINDFLLKKAGSLDEVVERTAYGPAIAGGDSSCLGAGNIGFARKLKLMKALRKMDADIVVADLGGDTAFNVLDFFLSAHAGLVMTTCDPAAYLEAYAFIKVGLYRKLDRIFGPESFYTGPQDPVLRRVIQTAVNTAKPSGITDIPGLRKKIRERTRTGLMLFDQALADYAPRLIVNRAESSRSALPPVQRIQKVCRGSLELQVHYLGCLGDDPGMQASARTLIPFVTTNDAGAYTSAMAAIIPKILCTEVHCRG